MVTPTCRMLALASALAACRSVVAAVAVISNHTEEPVRCELRSGGSRQSREIQPGESTPVFSGEPVTVTFATGAGPRVESIVADSAYRFATVRSGRGGTTLALRRIGLGGANAPPNPAAWRTGVGSGDTPIRVLLCVDEEEPRRPGVWQSRLEERLVAASDIVRKHSGVRFEPAGFATWRSNNNEIRFENSLREFEQSVRPEANVLAIGFTNQYHVQRGRHRMGGTRGPLRDHILVREWSPRVSEAERVELLVHELGHFLGAAHSPEPTSVMRPVLGDRPVRLKEEEIRFDAVNTLAIAMVGEEVRRLGTRRLTGLTASRRLTLQRLYGTLAAVTPGEPAALALLRGLARGKADRAAAGGIVTAADRVAGESSLVVAAVTRAAAANRKLPVDERLAGDALTDQLARVGAAATDDAKALLVGLGVALDDVGGLQINPRTRETARLVETDIERRRRLNVLGRPTARNRHDTLKHFFVSAALVALVGENEADLWGVGKELADATRAGGSGFSFADMAANRAGVRFAKGVLAHDLPTVGLRRTFRIQNYVPSLEGLEEGLPLSEVTKRFGGPGDPRFDARIQEVDKRIESLPAYSLPNLPF